MPGSTTGPLAAWAGTPKGAVISSREQAAVAQAARLYREVRRTIASPLKLRGRATHLLEREDDALGSGFSMFAPPSAGGDGGTTLSVPSAATKTAATSEHRRERRASKSNTARAAAPKKVAAVEQDGRMRGARAAALLLIVALLLRSPIPAYAQDQVIETELMVPGTPEADGKPVKLDATILTTDPATPRPAIVLAHGFGGTKADSEPTARTLALAGYTVIIYTARGFGASGGRIHLDNPAYEGADTRKLIDLAASRPEVAKDGDDPVIGFAGASYGGAVSFLAAGLDHRVDAIAPAFTWHSLRQALFPAVPGCRCGQVAGRCQSREPPGRVQTALGLIVVLQRRRTTSYDQPGVYQHGCACAVDSTPSCAGAISLPLRPGRRTTS